ncbi:MAG: TauD/TfdA family dioxygenase [Proteobacteria bacterium]|nr:TauD/TfdA family dioxygenase [Pseudomonadota bacterium]
MAVTFRPLAGSFGAEVVGVDPTLAVEEQTFQAIEAAWYRYSILLFRGLAMTPAQHVQFTRRLGPLHVMQPVKYNHPDHPEVFIVSNAVENGQALGMRRVGLGFHTDGEDKILPNAGSFLYARKVSAEGGDTMWADMYAAWERLPDDIKGKVLGRRARFSRVDLHHVHYPEEPALTEEQKCARPDAWHPIARRHPRTGRTALYIGRWAVDIEGLPRDEGRELIRELQAHSQRPEFIYRHRWQVGDAMLWDNRCTLHCATEFDEERYVRLMMRTTLEGEPPLLA